MDPVDEASRVVAHRDNSTRVLESVSLDVHDAVARPVTRAIVLEAVNMHDERSPEASRDFDSGGERHTVMRMDEVVRLPVDPVGGRHRIARDLCE